jgi:hypothetical protein
MELKEMQAIMRECQQWELGHNAGDAKKTARIALCAAVKLYAACFQTRAEAHACLDLAFDRVEHGSGVASAVAGALAAIAVVGNAQGVSLEVATTMAPRIAKPLWAEWRRA